MSSCSRSAAVEAETVASEGGMVTVAEAMEKGVGVRGVGVKVGVKVVVTVAEEMASGMAAAAAAMAAAAMAMAAAVMAMAAAVMAMAAAAMEAVEMVAEVVEVVRLMGATSSTEGWAVARQKRVKMRRRAARSSRT